ncbi:hypothetical protein JCM17823_04510 [Halorubrum gandharaense]
MRYYQLPAEGDRRLFAEHEGARYDLTAVKPGLQSFGDLLQVSTVMDRPMDDIARRLFDEAPAADGGHQSETASLPLVPEEVWAAGVTYQISEEARESESSMPDMYMDVYNNERPEIFFKATPNRLVGPHEPVGIRRDSEWDVPEPELGIILYRGNIVGYTVGNDMSSRSIEGENPLYLPQAKVYDRCCSIGPCVRSADSLDDPHDLEMEMRITRDGEVLYEESTNTGKMVRSVEELTDYYNKHNSLPELSVLLTGTSLVPDEGFTLKEGDVVDISVEEIGTLTNSVTTV